VWEGSVERNCEPMNKNRIEGVAEQGERAKNREALVIKARWRRSGGCAVKECVLTWGDLASWLKGRRGNTEREVIDGRPRFAKRSIDDGKQVEIAAIDPDFDRGHSLCP